CDPGNSTRHRAFQELGRCRGGSGRPPDTRGEPGGQWTRGRFGGPPRGDPEAAPQRTGGLPACPPGRKAGGTTSRSGSVRGRVSQDERLRSLTTGWTRVDFHPERMSGSLSGTNWALHSTSSASAAWEILCRLRTIRRCSGLSAKLPDRYRTGG